jgi:hypothetical protein
LELPGGSGEIVSNGLRYDALSRMNRVPLPLRKFAERLITYEASESKAADPKVPALFQACDKLRPQLANLMGNGGFRALVSRSLALANEEVHWLRAVHVKADGSFEGLKQLQEQVGAKEFLEGRVVLLARLLGLLVAFIGENLTLRLVRDVWPKVILNDLGFDIGGKNEETKTFPKVPSPVPATG